MYSSLDIVKSMLKRHKFRLSYDDKEQVFTLASTGISIVAILVFIVGPIIIGAIIAGFIIFICDAPFEFRGWITIGLMVPLQLYGGRFLVMKYKKNWGVKLFYPDKLVIKQWQSKNEIPLSAIEGFTKNFFDEELDDDISIKETSITMNVTSTRPVEGELLLVTKSGTYVLLHIYDDIKRYVENDLTLFEKFLQELWFSEKT